MAIETNNPKTFREYLTLGKSEKCGFSYPINRSPMNCQTLTTELIHYAGFRFYKGKIELNEFIECSIRPICSECKLVLEEGFTEIK